MTKSIVALFVERKYLMFIVKLNAKTVATLGIALTHKNMKNISIKNIKVSLLALLIASFSILYCSDDTKSDLTAEEILNQSSLKLDTWTSFRFGLEHEKGLTSLSNGLYQLKSVRGEVILPRRVKLETNVITFGQLIKLDVVLIDGQSYWTNPINQKWSKIPEGQSPFGTFDVGEVILDILSNMKSPEKLPTSSKNIEIIGKVDAEVFEPLVGVSDPGKIADVTITIDLENMNVISAEIAGKVNPLDEEDVVRIIEIWDVDVEFKVEPPL